MDSNLPNLDSNNNFQIEREKQKTKRAFYILIGVIACIGLILVFRGTDGTRKVDIDISKGKFSFSVDKPILEQINQSKDSAVMRGETVDYTTGTVKTEVVEQLKKENGHISSTRFTGKNLISEEGGYILTVEHPEKYTVKYNPEGLTNSFTPINSIYAGNYGIVNITRSVADTRYSFPEQVEAAIKELLTAGYINQMPQISYDKSRLTAFLTYTNQQTGGISYQKITMKNGMVYAATANYNATLTPQSEKEDMINMVASFTGIN